MKMLWKYVDRMSLPNLSKQKLFLALHFLIWIILSLLFCIFIGLVRGIDSFWFEIAFILIGYVSIIWGFLGGWIYLSNHT